MELHDEGVVGGGSGQDFALADDLVNLVLVEDVLLADDLHCVEAAGGLLADYQRSFSLITYP